MYDMVDQFIGELRVFAFGIVPPGWLPCDGQVLSVTQYEPLYALIGTTYGGNGSTTFALPDLRGRVPVHVGEWPIYIGSAGGEERHALSVAELPQHTHSVTATSDAATATSPIGGYWADAGRTNFAPAPSETMSATATAVSGNNQAHDNMSPFLALNVCIAYDGTWPPRE